VINRKTRDPSFEFYDLQTQVSPEHIAETLQRLLAQHRKYVGMLKDSNIRLLALMRERNLFIEKCRKVEALGNSRGGQGSVWQSLQLALYNSEDPYKGLMLFKVG
jgi:hypothetical protein